MLILNLIFDSYVADKKNARINGQFEMAVNRKICFLNCE